MAEPVYLDHQATTPVDPRVLEAMLPLLGREYGNASSGQHARGRRTALLVEEARVQVAALIGARPSEIIFTSGATEANNLAIKGLADTHVQPGHMISCQTEHPAVLQPLRALERAGWQITLLPVDSQGELNLNELETSIRADTKLISLMTANNEIGTLHPLSEICSIAAAHDVPVHTDAAQAVGKIGLDVEQLGVTLLSLSAHKVYGPQGIGALCVRGGGRALLSAQLDGGGQERGIRSGTLNAPGIAGLGAACAIARNELPEEFERVGLLRNMLCDCLQDAIGEMIVNGPPAARQLPGALHVSFRGVDADAVIANCTGAELSSGSACASAVPGPSHVLRAVGMDEDLAEGSLRMSVGRFTSNADVERAVAAIAAAVARVRALNGSVEKEVVVG